MLVKFYFFKVLISKLKPARQRLMMLIFFLNYECKEAMQQQIRNQQNPHKCKALCYFTSTFKHCRPSSEAILSRNFIAVSGRK